MPHEESLVYCKIYGQEIITYLGKVFTINLAGSSHYYQKDLKNSIIKAEGNIINKDATLQPSIVNIKVLSTKLDRDIAFKKSRRKRYQRTIGYRSTLLTLKALSVQSNGS